METLRSVGGFTRFCLFNSLPFIIAIRVPVPLPYYTAFIHTPMGFRGKIGKRGFCFPMRYRPTLTSIKASLCRENWFHWGRIGPLAGPLPAIPARWVASQPWGASTSVTGAVATCNSNELSARQNWVVGRRCRRTWRSFVPPTDGLRPPFACRTATAHSGLDPCRSIVTVFSGSQLPRRMQLKYSWSRSNTTDISASRWCSAYLQWRHAVLGTHPVTHLVWPHQQDKPTREA